MELIKQPEEGKLWFSMFAGAQFLMIFFQIVLWDTPIYWNRIQLVTIVIQASYLAWLLQRCTIPARTASIGMAAVVALGVFVRTLADPALASYVPFQWLPLAPVIKYGSDGEDRFFESLDLHTERNVK